MQAAGNRKIAIAIRLDPDDITMLKATAMRRGLTVSSVVRRALRTAGAIG
jgi:predicted DNA binding CopG/RHH family protein